MHTRDFLKKKFSRYSALFMVAVFSLACFSAVMPMSMTDGGDMSKCPFMANTQALCEMNVLEHIAAWRSAFSSDFSQQNIFGFLALLFAAALCLKRTSPPPRVLSRVPARSHEPQRPTLFQELFSQGLLNRKEPYVFNLREITL